MQQRGVCALRTAGELTWIESTCKKQQACALRAAIEFTLACTSQLTTCQAKEKSKHLKRQQREFLPTQLWLNGSICTADTKGMALIYTLQVPVLSNCVITQTDPVTKGCKSKPTLPAGVNSQIYQQTPWIS